MNTFPFKFGLYLLLMGFLVQTQAAPPTTNMQTYSPYSAEQLKELNNQPLSPIDGPFGPVESNQNQWNSSKRPLPDAQYYYQPEGEEEAEALEMQSAEPYQPSSPVIPF